MSIDSIRSFLQRFDKKIDIEYNGLNSRYYITHVDPNNRKYVLGEIKLGEAHLFDPRAFIRSIIESSPRFQGGAAALNAKIDAEYARFYEKSEAADKSFARDLAKESHDIYRWAGGSRVSQFIPEVVTYNKSKEDVPAFTVKDRRRGHLALVD